MAHRTPYASALFCQYLPNYTKAESGGKYTGEMTLMCMAHDVPFHEFFLFFNYFKSS